MLQATTAPTPRRTRRAPRAAPAARNDGVEVRAVRRADLDQVVAIDTAVTGIEKRAYWASVYRRYGVAGRGEQTFLVALAGGRVVGYVIGEVRDWEFGSPPCGWVFAINVDPQARLDGIGTRLLEAISDVFRRAGVTKLRTLLARDNTLILSFFRSQGLMAGPLMSLERDLIA
jgi:ribosomal protein S18 acetylase RimI-like enzyme